MKNREKYAAEINNYKGKDFCGDFIRPIILKREKCKISCKHCSMLQMLWLNEEYEEEEQLEKLYGGKMPLDEVVENLNRIIQNGEEKLDYARILTNAEAEKWDKWKDLEEQGRLIELPCAVGDTVYWISESDACLFCNGPCYERCEEGALKIKEIPFKPHMLNEIGEIIFLTREEAEAKLAEMEGAE